MSDRDVEVLKSKVDKILFYLHNDEATGEKGLVAEVHDLRKQFTKFVDTYKIEKAYRKGIFAAFGFIGAAIWTIVEYIAKHFF